MLRSIGEVSKKTGCNIETIRYYERVGLLPVPSRTAGGHRVFDETLVRRLKFVRRCRELGFPLDEVRALLGLVDGGGYTCEEVRTLTVGQLASVRGKIADLRQMEATLDDMARRCGGGTVPDCPIIEALFDEHQPVPGQ